MISTTTWMVSMTTTWISATFEAIIAVPRDHTTGHMRRCATPTLKG